MPYKGVSVKSSVRPKAGPTVTVETGKYPARLTPAEARDLAAYLVQVADELDGGKVAA